MLKQQAQKQRVSREGGERDVDKSKKREGMIGGEECSLKEGNREKDRRKRYLKEAE